MQFVNLHFLLDKHSEEVLSRAESFKETGNGLLRQNKYPEAIESYTRAIELIPQSSVYYGNRSQARLNIQDFEGALKDAIKSIELDQSYAKAYYRKAVANKGLGNYQTALEEFQRLQNSHPNDKVYQKQIQYCKTLISQQGNVS